MMFNSQAQRDSPSLNIGVLRVVFANKAACKNVFYKKIVLVVALEGAHVRHQGWRL